MLKTILPICFIFLFYSSSFSQQLFTKNEIITQEKKDGSCYATAFYTLPDVYETVTEQTFSKTGSTRIIPVPPTFKTKLKKIKTCDAYRTNDIATMQFDSSYVIVKIKDAYTKIQISPSRYETTTEQIIEKEGEHFLALAKDAIDCLDKNTEDCPVFEELEGLPNYKTIFKQIIASPGGVRTLQLLEKTTKVLILKPLNSTPSGSINVPAKYEIISQVLLATPPTTKTVEIPAEYQPLIFQHSKSGGRQNKTVQILCDSDILSKMPTIKQALKAKGYTIKTIDNDFSKDAKIALLEFQLSKGNNFPIGQLDMETLRALGVE